MLDDAKKSFSSVLYERTTSPFYGTLICAWVIWNWKIFYLTFFISADKIQVNKIDYILTNYSEIWHIVWYPLMSTIVLLTVIPFVSNGAYWLSIIFNKWKIDKKNTVDRLQLLSLEQSIDLREQMSKQGEIFDKMLEKQSLEIKQLIALLDEYKKKPISAKTNLNTTNNFDPNSDDLKELATRFKENPKELYKYENLIDGIYGRVESFDFVPLDFIQLLVSYNIISGTGTGTYKVTDTGKMFHRLMVTSLGSKN